MTKILKLTIGPLLCESVGWIAYGSHISEKKIKISADKQMFELDLKDDILIL